MKGGKNGGPAFCYPTHGPLHSVIVIDDIDELSIVCFDFALRGEHRQPSPRPQCLIDITFHWLQAVHLMWFHLLNLSWLCRWPFTSAGSWYHLFISKMTGAICTCRKIRKIRHLLSIEVPKSLFWIYSLEMLLYGLTSLVSSFCGVYSLLNFLEIDVFHLVWAN